MADKRSDGTKYAVGDWFSRIEYARVMATTGTSFSIRAETGKEWSVGRDIVEAQAWSATQFTSEEKISCSEMGAVFASAGDAVFCVTYTKKIVVADIVTELETADVSTLAKRRKLAKAFTVGEERKLVGYLTSTKHEMGRYPVVDLEVPEGAYNRRLVDTRTLKSLILKNVRYTLK